CLLSVPSACSRIFPSVRTPSTSKRISLTREAFESRGKEDSSHKVPGSGFRVLGSRVPGSWFVVRGSGFQVLGSGFRTLNPRTREPENPEPRTLNLRTQNPEP